MQLTKLPAIELPILLLIPSEGAKNLVRRIWVFALGPADKLRDRTSNLKVHFGTRMTMQQTARAA